MGSKVTDGGNLEREPMCFFPLELESHVEAALWIIFASQMYIDI